MPQDSAHRHRRSTRLRGYDYAQAGAYVVTLVTAGRTHRFGEIANDRMVLSAAGRIAEEEWMRNTHVRREIELDAFVVMPNHIHGIVLVLNDMDVVGATGGRPHGVPNTIGDARHGQGDRRSPLPNGLRPKSLGALVGGYKSAVTKGINALGGPAAPVWQRNYHDRIIRNERELMAFRKYIEDNPMQWVLDRENTRNL